MRTSFKMVAAAAAATAMLGATAATASAYGKAGGDETTILANVCGNTAQGADVDNKGFLAGILSQQSNSTTLCQLGNDNFAVNTSVFQPVVITFD
ncbi:hypothetical protein GCM10027160_14090 [Streptomyces calidiresistens]|uniref:Secreted protein n=1 Tax=Streptomyces calidiresistens TaxID=1485586 RepID=A0A7W3T8L7_9ACTN|nr:hypothetical protein [Streptomyces calidiresistens]MBB0232932.1 hypothetical protein [Streptomyces calidiresistens]